jgi:hypothetical protein
MMTVGAITAHAHQSMMGNNRPYALIDQLVNVCCSGVLLTLTSLINYSHWSVVTSSIGLLTWLGVAYGIVFATIVVYLYVMAIPPHRIT